MRSLTIWVDALCVNQNNIAERTHKVSIMREVYSKARTVVVFLSLHNNDVIDSTNALAETSALSADDSAYDSYHPNVSNLKQAGVFIIKLFELRYFTRGWVI
jgi:hypothetical protein